MKKLIDVYPLFEAERVFNKTYRSIRRMKFDEDTVFILHKMFRFSRILDTFFCQHLPLDVVFDDVPPPNPLLVDSDEAADMLRRVCKYFEDLMKEVNTVIVVFPSSFHRDLDKVQAILFRLKNATE